MYFASADSILRASAGNLSRLVLAGWCVFYFLCLDQYLFETGVLPFHHAMLVAPFAASVVALAPQRRLIDGEVALYVWCLVFTAWTLLGLSAGPLGEGAIWEVGARVSFVVFLSLSFFMFHGSTTVTRDFALIASSACLVVVPMLIVDLFMPHYFSSLNVGRPAGVYINPNRAAFALVLGHLIAQTTLRGRLRTLQLVLTWIGVLLTASRAGILLMALASLAFAFDRRQSLDVFVLRLLAVCAAAVALASFVGWAARSGTLDTLGVLSTQMESRLETMLAFDLRDFSTLERESASLEALRVLSDNPFLGAGPGITRVWDEVPTHNMYLYLGAESGLLGLLLFPALLMASGWSAIRRGGLPLPHVLLVMAFLVWAFFSNSIFGEKCFVIVIAWMAARCSVSSSPHTPDLQPSEAGRVC